MKINVLLEKLLKDDDDLAMVFVPWHFVSMLNIIVLCLVLF